MLNRRFDQEQDEPTPAGSTASPVRVPLPLAAETLRSVANPPVAEKHAEKKEDEKISLFWRVFGGTILSIVALVLMTFYNNLTSSIADLRAEVGKLRDERASLPKKEDVDAVRGDLAREKEGRAGYIKKEDYDTRSRTMYDRIRAVEGFKTDIETVRERVTANATAVEGVRKETAAIETIKARVEASAMVLDGLKKDTAGIEVLRERIVAVEGLKKDVAMIDLIKEKLTTATGDLKLARDELQKLQQEVDRNKTADQERKASRDSQYKALEDAQKDLQKMLQECREKLARFEGAQPAIPRGVPLFPAEEPKPATPKPTPKRPATPGSD